MLVLALGMVAAILSGIVLMQGRFQPLGGWALLALSIAVILMARGG